MDTIIKFKNALGIDDPDAAAMHMEVLLCFIYLFIVDITPNKSKHVAAFHYAWGDITFLKNY